MNNHLIFIMSGGQAGRLLAMLLVPALVVKKSNGGLVGTEEPKAGLIEMASILSFIWWCAANKLTGNFVEGRKTSWL